MDRVFTMRKACKACRSYFTITSAASMFCKDKACISRRRKADRLERKQATLKATTPPGSDAHLAQAIRSGD